jgi:uncharacterized protein
MLELVMEKYPSRRLDIAIRFAFVITVSLVIWRWPKAVHVSPSFDCAKATIPTEQVICRDPDLAKVDADFAVYYADNLATVAIDGDRATLDSLVAGQRNFLIARNRCGSNKLCVMQVYGDREKQLRGLVGLPAPDFFGEVSVNPFD